MFPEFNPSQLGRFPMTCDNPDVTEGWGEELDRHDDSISTPKPNDGNAKNHKLHVESELPLNPFDPERLRLSQDFASSVGVKEVLLSVPVTKPDNSWFVQTHPSDDYRMVTAVIELKKDREIYLVSPELRSALTTESTFGLRQIVTSITRQGVVFLWPVRLPRADGRIDDWSRTSLEATERARGKWCRVESDMALGAYRVREALGDLPPPNWPDMSFGDLLRIGFKDRFIDSMGHPVLRRLRGES